MAKKLGLKERLRQALTEYFVGRFGTIGDAEINLVGDLILLRCREGLSPAELNVGTLKAGRLLLLEVGERLCGELQPELSKLLHEITGRRVVDVGVAFLWQRREKIYLLTMSGTVKH